MARVIVVTSGKGGVGKTTISSLLGRYLAKNGEKVVLIDADLGLKNLDVVLGLESRVIYDLEDIVKGRATIKQALVQDKVSPLLYLLPASLRIEVTDINESYMTSIVNQLNADFDYIIIDSPAGIEKGFFNAIKNAKEAIVVLTLDKTSLRDGDKVIGLLKNNQINDIKLVINRYNKRDESQLSLAEVERIMNVEIIAKIPESKDIKSEQNYGLLITKNSDADIAFKNLSNKILGKEEIISKPNFMSRFIKTLSKS